MKSTYYVATVVNAYRRAIDNYLRNLEPTFDYITELQKNIKQIIQQLVFILEAIKKQIKILHY